MGLDSTSASIWASNLTNSSCRSGSMAVTMVKASWDVMQELHEMKETGTWNSNLENFD